MCADNIPESFPFPIEWGPAPANLVPSPPRPRPPVAVAANDDGDPPGGPEEAVERLGRVLVDHRPDLAREIRAVVAALHLQLPTEPQHRLDLEPHDVPLAWRAYVAGVASRRPSLTRRDRAVTRAAGVPPSGGRPLLLPPETIDRAMGVAA